MFMIKVTLEARKEAMDEALFCSYSMELDTTLVKKVFGRYSPLFLRMIDVYKKNILFKTDSVDRITEESIQKICNVLKGMMPLVEQRKFYLRCLNHMKESLEEEKNPFSYPIVDHRKTELEKSERALERLSKQLDQVIEETQISVQFVKSEEK